MAVPIAGETRSSLPPSELATTRTFETLVDAKAPAGPLVQSEGGGTDGTR
jgi:hypothetical protein